MNEALRSAGLACLKLLNSAGYEAWWVGGCVRDGLLGRPVEDIDITTSALPEQTMECFQSQGHSVIPTGIKHGTVTVMMQNFPIEVTVYRTDRDYQDHRHPRSIQFVRSLKEDCARRDFTINALCWHPELGFQDYFGGQQDLKKKSIRCIGDPCQRLDEDALRILRALRFSAALDFTIEPETHSALFQKMELLRVLSAERIAREIRKMVIGQRWPEVFTVYHELLAVLFPQLPALQSPAAIQKTFDAFRLCPRVTLPRTACFFLASQQTPLEVCLDQAQHWSQQLKLSNHDRKRLILLVQNQNRWLPKNRIDLRRLICELPDLSVEWIQLQQALCRLDAKQAGQWIAAIEEIQNTDCLTLKQLAVNGYDLIAAGCPKTEISACLNQTLSAVIEDQVPNQKEALLTYIRQQAKPESQD